MLSHRLLLGFLLLSLMLGVGPARSRAQSDEPGAAPPGFAPSSGSGSVEISGYVRVIDGDTIEVRINGARVGIGLIGVTAPMGNTDCGREAAARLRALVRGGIVLEEDPGLVFDERSRRMYHVKTRDGRSIAEALISEGVARFASDQGATHADSELATAEAASRAAGRGCIWEELSSQYAATTFSKMRLPSEVRAVVAAPVAAATLPGGFSEIVVAGGLTLPTAFTFLPDGRILIAQQNGVVRVYKGGALLSTPFIDLQDRVNDYWDHGLLGIAADPNFAMNGHVYLLYVYENNPAQYNGTKTSRLTRVTVASPLADTASPNTEVVLLGTSTGTSCNNFPIGTDCIPADGASHTVGRIKFAVDGSLFLTSGDAADWNTVNDNAHRAQNLDSLAGKLLRVNPDGTGLPSNPFWTGDAQDNRSKIWAYGFRNPYRFNLRPGSLVPYVGDVGHATREEITVALPGSNAGWPCYEGDVQQAGYAPRPLCQALYANGPSAVRWPLITYPAPNTAVTSGTFYTGTAYPEEYQGAFFYGDYVQSWIRYLRVDDADALVGNAAGFATNASGPVFIDMGPDQSLYYVSILTGELRRIRYTASQNRQPVAVVSATPTNGVAPLTVQFSGAVSSDPDGDPLQYNWDFGDATPASTAMTPQHTYGANGTYVATLTVTDNRGGVSTATVTITVGNRAPVPTINTPTTTQQFKVGDTIAFDGSASDPDGETIPASSLDWEIKIHHCQAGLCHIHRFTTSSGASGTFEVPNHGDESYFELILTATDSGGLVGATSVKLFPQTVQLTLDTVPSGMKVVYDGVLATAPLTRTTIAGSTHTIQAPSPQGPATFVSWSDGGARDHDVTVGTSNVTYVATFNAPDMITFDDLAGQDQVLTGQYPTGVINWGTSGAWLHSSPWGAFTTKSLSFANGSTTSATFTLIGTRRLVRVDAYNGGTVASTVTISCPGQPTKTTTVAVGQVVTIDTGWTASCAAVTFASTNGWNVNYDNLVHQADASTGPTATPTVTPTTGTGPTPTPTSTATPTATATVTPTTGPTPQTVTFNDRAGQDQALTGQYPTGVIDWGTSGVWWHSSPWGAFTTKSLSFTTSSTTSATFTLIGTRRLVRVDAYNGGTVASTVTISCPGQATKTTTVPVGQVVTIDTGWTASCAAVTFASTNGWNVNYDNLVLQVDEATGPTATATATATPTVEPASTPTVTSTPTATPTVTSTATTAAGTTPTETVTSTATSTATTTATATTPAGMTPTPTPTSTATSTRTPTATSTITPTTGPTTQTVTFDDRPGQNQILTGQYPAGVINWGTSGTWLHSSPWGAFTTKSLSFANGSISSATFTLIGTRRLIRVDAYNGGTVASTVTISCPGQPTKTTTVAVGQVVTIDTGWTASCAAVTFASTNGWNVNYDNLVHQADASTGPTATPTVTPTTGTGPTPTPTSTATPTATATVTPTAGPTPQTVTFNDRAGQDQALTGQYPTGVIDWGTSGVWWHSSPWGAFTTKSLSFTTSSTTSATFTLIGTRRLARVDAYNGGTVPSTVTISCPGQPTKTTTIAVGQIVTIDTGWTVSCAAVTFASTNGWNVNYDNLVLQPDSLPPP